MKPKSQIISCPKCHKNNPYDFYKVLIEKENNVAIKKLIKNRLFNFKCRHCKHTANIQYDLIYLDYENKIEIQLVSPSMADFVANSYYAQNTQKQKNQDAIRRIVVSPEELKEKILIFRHKLDDRIIELIKAAIAINIMQKHPHVIIENVIFKIKSRCFLLEILGNCPNKVIVDKKLYNEIKYEFNNYLTKDTNSEFFIDKDWACKVMEKHFNL